MAARILVVSGVIVAIVVVGVGETTAPYRECAGVVTGTSLF
ncbi:hypothetical protein PF010_g6162 [Phytophthora fragariae]|uniref:RxLR effector protein n=1 Tax=Phytophthora fragariae TaxID=53985 RepID=A0A6A3SU29_9STRA|nr:hypothetical protein PF009_g7624 [Phytophthora fragariae]KAE9019768.1 hypothetical protein PF011_g5697 [Phytophthora fragariae]KAE9123340.1 hypothetical protein PF007_g7089 [Phytophthora fragariae]KAE9124076.1 hypothetical protein PF010_g6162 [Phytophthora fragariae]KAE9244187.1 hypothetical protein PF002_g7896 [Phytophthora fragariae]